MKKFELDMCWLGGGITVCNKAVKENGEYQQIAHISYTGNIRFYVPVTSIPGPDLLRIEHRANAMYEKAKQTMERDIAVNRAVAYYRMSNALPYSVFMQFCHDTDGESDEAKIEKLKRLYLQYA